MLPFIDVVRRDEVDYLLMNTQDYIGHSLKNSGVWGEVETALCINMLQGTKNKGAVLDNTD